MESIMDRFRFRVFDVSLREMSYPESTPVCFADGELAYFYRENLGDLIPLQCTGIKDKNQTLIYDGDIVKTWKFSTGETSLRVVAWNSARCGFRLYTILDFIRGLHDSPQSMVNVSTMEVVGNIYEDDVTTMSLEEEECPI